MDRVKYPFELRGIDSFFGALIGVLILVAWASLLISALGVVPWGDGVSWAYAPVVVIVQMFLYTGLFITAHDAMHGVACWGNQTVNAILGQVALWCYALFPLRKLKAAHQAHHDHPARSGDDPDFHDGKRRGFFAWYFSFMWNYLSVVQFVGMALIFNVLAHLVGVSEVKLVVFWVLPSLLSTVQLFYFGTYLPHREEGGYPDEHRARSNNYSPWLSFLTCYHFGYHLEHHAAPSAPWWRLPEVRKQALETRA